MDKNEPVHAVQTVILQVMKYIDSVCRQNGIEYFIMGGTALGAVRHGGFIPWDDDLDIFMTPGEYEKFKAAMKATGDDRFVLQEWRTVPEHLEYAKVRMNGTTFIEEHFKDCRDMHHGIYVDIMILHKVPKSRLVQRMVYVESKFVTLYALTQRNWKAKNRGQALVVQLLKFLPCKLLAKMCYKHIYAYDGRKKDYLYCYWITPAKFRNGLFAPEFFDKPVDIPFEDTVLLGSSHIKDYLRYRYGDYMKMPSEEERKAAVHAMIYDTEKDYKEYFK